MGRRGAAPASGQHHGRVATAYGPLQPYGPLVGTSVRVVTWNLWSNLGPWETRYEDAAAELRALDPDLVALQEVWRAGERDVAAELGASLGGGRHCAAALEWFEPLGLDSGCALLSRWPVGRHEHRRVPGSDGGDGALFQYVEVDGPRGPLDVFVVMLDWRPDLSHVRQQQVRELAGFVREVGRRRRPTVVCGDFNAPPDSDELRVLTGRAQPPAPGFVFYDAWEVAGGGGPGHTWSNANRWAAAGLLPDRRIDYVLSGWPRAGGVGHPVRCELVGTASAAAGGPPSDHYGVLADLRY